METGPATDPPSDTTAATAPPIDAQTQDNPDDHKSEALPAGSDALHKLQTVVMELKQHPGAETATEILARTATLGSRWTWINWTYVLIFASPYGHAVALRVLLGLPANAVFSLLRCILNCSRCLGLIPDIWRYRGTD
jgi:hypothetical protein